MLNDSQIAKFQLLWKNRFNEEISKEVALKEGVKMITLVMAICRPTNDAEYQRLKELSEKIKSSEI